MRSIDDYVAGNPLPSGRAVANLIILLIIGILVWAYFARLDEVSSAPGEVIPQGQVKVIQHLEGGIVSEIHVVEGQPVAKGARLVRLELGLNSANTAELRLQIDGLTIKRTRLMAEAAAKPLRFSEKLIKSVPDLVRSERATFESRRAQNTATLSVLRSRTRQRVLAVTEVKSTLKGRESNLRLMTQRLAMSQSLLENNLVPKMEHLALESDVETLRTTIAELRSSLPKLRAALAEARDREQVEKLNFRRGVMEEIGQVELAIAQNRELLTRADDQVRRTSITSPIEGVVKNLRYNTIGGVVRAGEAIMEIVPSRDKLVVETKLDPIDVGYVRKGQPAVVKLLTYDFVRYGGLDGTVINVAADSSVGRDGVPYFRVVIETDKPYLGDRPGQLPITPGMQAIVDIHTGTKTVLDYLITPILKLKGEAFRER